MEQKRINFDPEYADAIISGQKVTTVRKGIKRYPVGRIVDLTANSRPFARARIDRVVVKRVRELTDHDAKLDGFENRDRLIEALERIYGGVGDEEFVTVVHFTVVDVME